MKFDEFVTPNLSRIAVAEMNERRDLPRFLRFLFLTTIVVRTFISERQANHLRDKFESNGNINYKQAWMSVMLARSVFYWAGHPSFENLMQRLARVDFEAAFNEVNAAHYFRLHGWDILARPVTGIKGEDFDFIAIRNEIAMNVEVTALEKTQVDKETLFRKLQKKRRQLPKIGPNAIYCLIPEEWAVPDVDDILADVANRFFLVTERVSCVLFAVSMWPELRPALGSAIDIVTPRHATATYVYGNATSPFSVDLSLVSTPGFISQRKFEFDKWFMWLLWEAEVSSRDFRPT
ncbi:hypothetical protein NBH20_01775 [Rhizobium sp. S153]|uniref:Uncharacterized protein n=1 Tax=Ciceribacter sichuanensis TaxID=2949647 RepID=A0ABT0V1V4_9HYPH|nr:hypothetical protein [Ciceribacter sp. S153]MCM2399869.1 hypothetical protein [Ciceribacter sp. S153]